VTKATLLVFLLFNVTSTQEVPFGILQCVQCNLLELVAFIFADSEKCQFVAYREIFCTFLVATLIAEVLFDQLLIHVAVEHTGS